MNQFCDSIAEKSAKLPLLVVVAEEDVGVGRPRPGAVRARRHHVLVLGRLRLGCAAMIVVLRGGRRRREEAGGCREHEILDRPISHS